MADDGHNHQTALPALTVGLGVTLAFAAVEATTGVLAGSLALVADAGHMLVDSSGLVLALVAGLLAKRPPDPQRTYGYARIEVLVVPLQVMVMALLAGYIIYEAVNRIGGPQEVAGWPVLGVGLAGLVLNIVVLRLLHPHGATNLSARGASLEVLFDLFGSVGVIISAVVILATGWYGVDIILSLVIGALVVPRALTLLRDVVAILLEGTPRSVDLTAIERDVRDVAGVSAIHDLHVWSLAPSFIALSAHLEVASLDGCGKALAEVTAILRDRHHISHVTLQPETVELHNLIACCLQPDAPKMQAHAH